MKYVIVINSYKRSLHLVERCLRASLNQKIPPVKVILIDQNSEELNLPGDISNNPVFSRQRTVKRSVSEARNTIQIPSSADWIFFCDDDGYPCEDYSERLAEIISEQKEIEILAGSIIRTDNKEYYSLRHQKGGSLKYFRNTKNLMGSNFVIKSTVFDELGRFDESFGVGSYWGSSEETDFCWKAYFTGKRMEYFPELIVYHIPPFNESVKTGFKKAFFYGIGKGALVGKWLFNKRKFKVLYELIEMFIVPFIQSIRGLITLRFALILTNIAALSGRIYGMFKYIFVRK